MHRFAENLDVLVYRSHGGDLSDLESSSKKSRLILDLHFGGLLLYLSSNIF
jgi:hypothetical protein